MTFAEFCDTVENTEQEQQFFQMLKKDNMRAFAKMMDAMRYLPITGKTFAAMYRLSQSDSLADFRQTAYYAHIMDSPFRFNFDTGSLHIGSNDAQKQQMKQAATVMAAVGAVVAVPLLLRKWYRGGG